MWSGVILWLYLGNLVLLILHEMDSAYWKEWELFHIPGGIVSFLLLHIPLYAVGLFGLVLLARSDPAGSILALVVAAAGIAAFSIHSYFLGKGRPEFNTVASKGLLAATLICSAALAIVTLAGLAG
jgi:hypothetical protein